MRLKKMFSTLRATLFILSLATLGFIIYVLYVNKNSTNMTVRQKVLKAIYPLTMWFTKKAGKNTLSLSDNTAAPVTSIYSLSATLNNGEVVSLSKFKGKKLMLVNTASDCGYTGQYEGLETLYQQQKDKLVILAFPANDFKQQEQASDEKIAAFCKLNFGVTFPLIRKSIVVKKDGQNEIFKWLSDKNKNGWNNQAPTWNFCKYLIDENGRLTHFFASSVEPSGSEVLNAIIK